MKADIWTILFSIGVFNGFFMAFLLSRKKTANPLPNRILSVMIISGSILTLNQIFHRVGFYVEYPHLLRLTFPLWFTLGPLLFLHVKYKINGAAKINKKEYLHVIPALLNYLFFIPFIILPAEQKLNITYNSGNGFSLEIMLPAYLLVIQTIIYCAYAVKLVRKGISEYKNKETQKDLDTFELLKKLVMVFVAYISVDTAASIYISVTQSDLIEAVYVSMLIMLSIFFVIAYNAIMYPELLFSEVQEEKEKYEKSGLNEGKAATILANLQDHLEFNKPYFNPELKLTDLSEQLGTSSNNLSQVINTQMHTTFYDLINTLRTEELKERLASGKYDDQTILAIAYDVGFNSKSTFNRLFKKYHGTTPTEFKKSLKGKNEEILVS